MDIQYITGDATNPQTEGLRVITHCCNDIGVWGAGFVIALSRRWPEPEAIYRRAGKLELGEVQFCKVDSDQPTLVANIIGQHQVGSQGRIPPIRYEALRLGFQTIANSVLPFRDKTPVSVHMPRIGCGLAGGDWALIEPLLQAVFGRLEIPVYVYNLPGQSAEGGAWYDSRVS
jgi:O-acetyl-ADP-ribose deacetylase (regulator of RNase III)